MASTALKPRVLRHEGTVPTPGPRTPDPAILVASVMGRSPEVNGAALARMEEELGPLVYISEPLGFGWTPHHKKELGQRPERNIIAFDLLGDTSLLPEIKRTTCRLEVTLARPGGRREVNIDPGFLGEQQLIIASTWAVGHRVHIGKGVYGDLTLLRGDAGFEPLPWTTADYAAPEMRQIFADICGHLPEAQRRRRQL